MAYAAQSKSSVLTTVAKVIAIDGPSGSGKSTVAKEIAKHLNILYVDTGAMFRAVGLALDQHQIDFEDNQKLQDFLKTLKMDYGVEGTLIKINDEDLTHKIREHHVSGLASQVSQLPSIRQLLLDWQRQIARERFCVMEGRDIGTVIFLTANEMERARRRHLELSAKGQTLSFEQVLKDVRERDERDTARAHAPLKQAADAVAVSNDGPKPEAVVAKIIEIARIKAREKGLQLG
ncbi:MAG: (d)CMP kinase [Pseudomonadota bacterium]